MSNVWLLMLAVISLVISAPGATLAVEAAAEHSKEPIQNTGYALLLYDSSHPSNFDVNFCKIAEYYGQRCAQVALDHTDLSDNLLKNEQGAYFRLVGISADTLAHDPSFLSDSELLALEVAIKQGGANLFVAKARQDMDFRLLARLTDGAVVGASQPNATAGWLVSDVAPEITGVLTGQAFSPTHGVQNDFSLVLGDRSLATPLVSAIDRNGAAYPVLVSHKKGLGSVFIDSGESSRSLETMAFYKVYYWSRFSQIVPLMMAMRYAFGDRAWHSNRLLANLVIDDPDLKEPYEKMSYKALLRAMKAHNFHTTIGFIPMRWQESQPPVITLFRANPDRFSLVQHGNNHDGYEFYKYSVSAGDKYPARPLADQEADIIEGMARMAAHSARTGIPWGRVMMFSMEISPPETFALLKKHNFLGTVNGQLLPLGAAWPPDWDFGMYPALMEFETFPALLDRHPGTYHPFKPHIQEFVLDLFIGKPALFHSFAPDLFAESMDSFNPVADQVNTLYGGVQWCSLEDVLRHLYLEKTNDDGSVDVKMFSSELVVSNESGDERIYRFFKKESWNVPIASLTANGQTVAYQTQGELLTFDVTIPANSSVEVQLRYTE